MVKRKLCKLLLNSAFIAREALLLGFVLYILFFFFIGFWKFFFKSERALVKFSMKIKDVTIFYSLEETLIPKE